MGVKTSQSTKDMSMMEFNTTQFMLFKFSTMPTLTNEHVHFDESLVS